MRLGQLSLVGFYWSAALNNMNTLRRKLKKAVQQGRSERRGEAYVEPLSDARTPLADFFSFLRRLKGFVPWRHDKGKSNHLGRPGLVPHITMEASMRPLSIRSGHALVRRLIIILFLLSPWPVLAEEGATL